MRFVHEQTVDSEFFERQSVVLLLVCRERFELRFKPLLYTLQLLYETCAFVRALLSDGDFHFPDLLFDEVASRLL